MVHRLLASAGLTAIALLTAGPAHADEPTAAKPVVLRFATLAPEGSAWLKLFHQFQHKVEERTQKRVAFHFYTGGIQGDERDVLRKMKLGSLHGAALTTIGLSAIDPEVRTVEMAETYQQLDALRTELAPVLQKRIEERGYVLLGWGDVGPVRFFSTVPIKDRKSVV